MTAITSTTDRVEAPSSAQDMWSAGDYDRLASYGSAPEAARLVRFANVQPGERVLDVGTGSGLVAIVSAQHGAHATGVDPTPVLLEKARDNAALAGYPDIEWRHGVAEALPFPDASFDVVLSQYAHMFSPEPEAAAREMLRVLRPGGRIAFAAWAPDGLAPRLMGLSFSYLPPMTGAAPPSPFKWGDMRGVHTYLGKRVGEMRFESAALHMPALSTAHARRLLEETFGPTVLLVHTLASKPERLAQWRHEHDTLAADFFADGQLRFDYLLASGRKV